MILAILNVHPGRYTVAVMDDEFWLTIKGNLITTDQFMRGGNTCDFKSKRQAIQVIKATFKDVRKTKYGKQSPAMERFYKGYFLAEVK